MRVRISVALVMQSPIRHHSFTDEIILDVLTYYFNLAFSGKLDRKSNFDFPRHLRVGSLFDLLHFIPERRTITVFFRRIVRQHDFRMHDAALMSEVIRQSVFFIRQTFPGAVCRRCNGSSSAASADYFY